MATNTPTIPTVIIWPIGKGQPPSVWRIRLLPTPLLCYMLKGSDRGKMMKFLHTLNGGSKFWIALAQEVKRRGLKGYYLHLANRIDPSPCACGRAGLYIVGPTTYCSDHRSQAQQHLAKAQTWLNKGRFELGNQIEERLKRTDIAKAHHRAVGLHPRRRK